ncbi:uncharacterized protein KGF55_003427 [Candida pseudojiufengensis]|uniref:uncharacterized protein n=1 Tax=Candida pseudojiufengensis TaxID=497109 RepID=UPI002224E865|nr:uncharacterized protein KGF55_003427 [Candida pseudojiufengensis]KAI5962351.1 hypothetical protein KGF55_003427 [Candida pseudojiufengensis]
MDLYGNICELDITFGFDEVYHVLDELIIDGYIQEGSKKEVLERVNQQDELENKDEFEKILHHEYKQTTMFRNQAKDSRESPIKKSPSLIEKRQQLDSALASGKPLSKEVAEDENLQKDFLYDQSIQDEFEIDDEYSALSGINDPKILIITSRNPSVKLLQFSKKEINLKFPNSLKLNRGNYIINDLVKT